MVFLKCSCGISLIMNDKIQFLRISLFKSEQKKKYNLIKTVFVGRGHKFTALSFKQRGEEVGRGSSAAAVPATTQR